MNLKLSGTWQCVVGSWRNCYCLEIKKNKKKLWKLKEEKCMEAKTGKKILEALTRKIFLRKLKQEKKTLQKEARLT